MRKIAGELENSVERYLNRRVEESHGQSIKLDSKTGLPDRLILLPDGVVVFVEVKRPKGGKIAPMQMYWSEVLKRLGMEHRFVRNKEEVDALIMEYTCARARE